MGSLAATHLKKVQENIIQYCFVLPLFYSQGDILTFNYQNKNELRMRRKIQEAQNSTERNPLWLG